MKTIEYLHGIDAGVVARVSNSEAARLVDQDRIAKYVPKSRYKELHRRDNKSIGKGK